MKTVDRIWKNCYSIPKKESLITQAELKAYFGPDFVCEEMGMNKNV